MLIQVLSATLELPYLWVLYSGVVEMTRVASAEWRLGSHQWRREEQRGRFAPGGTLIKKEKREERKMEEREKKKIWKKHVITVKSSKLRRPMHA